MNEDKEIDIQLPNELAARLVDNILETSDKEIFDEAIEEYGDAEKEVSKLRRLVADAVQRGNKQKLIDARKAFDIVQKPDLNQLSHLSLSQKKSIIEKAIESANELTLAARNARDMTEDDTDTILKNFIELGLIDKDGTLL